ncbi:CLUMA_CG016856, isoform A [Clunio marinus]|uniref:CLUMA_CG016856, isoform A n=1 Tax=Clunio marinus TaxID=568069 RepID=A0A1J1IYH0_9DIPT|nr:CLUMA_CG016856, isoform A [Clunio marinus]
MEIQSTHNISHTTPSTQSNMLMHVSEAFIKCFKLYSHVIKVIASCFHNVFKFMNEELRTNCVLNSHRELAYDLCFNFKITLHIESLNVSTFLWSVLTCAG